MYHVPHSCKIISNLFIIWFSKSSTDIFECQEYPPKTKPFHTPHSRYQMVCPITLDHQVSCSLCKKEIISKSLDKVIRTTSCFNTNGHMLKVTWENRLTNTLKTVSKTDNNLLISLTTICCTFVGNTNLIACTLWL